MPRNDYLRITIGDFYAEVTDPSELPVSIDYSLEDPENFQNKTSSESFDLEIPATLLNDRLSNTYRNPSIEDLTTGELFKDNQLGVIECNGWELLKGKSFLKSSVHDYQPISYKYNLFGDNADWLVDLKEKTLYDFISFLTFSFTKDVIQASWLYDGTDELLPYVFAPVRYRQPFNYYFVDEHAVSVPDDDNTSVDYLRPSISKYWLIYWAFKSVGYKISSTFLDSEYFRRQVMPWTWGNFLDSDGTRLDKHKFLAKSVEDKYFNQEYSCANGFCGGAFIDLGVTNDSTNGAYDNNSEYSYNTSTFEMTWEYKAPDFGPLIAGFSAIVAWSYRMRGANDDFHCVVDWFINDVFQATSDVVQAESRGLFIPLPFAIGTQNVPGQTEIFFKTPITVALGDKVTAKVRLRLYHDRTFNEVLEVTLNILQFQLDYFRIALGSTVNFTEYTSGFQKHKWVDYFAGIVDEFNLSFNTDPINKIVYIEPTHPYSTTSDPMALIDGYFKNDYLNWNSKEDLSKSWEMTNYADNEREFNFKYKDDTNDGILKLIQDRNQTILASGKYVFPERFQTGEKDYENRFFSPTMHFPVTQFRDLGTGSNSGITPQMVCIIPENISQTSESESDNTFEPKSCYYKGLITGAGAWKWDGAVRQDFPFMFAVNYQAGGEDDPILSYSDEIINGVIGRGLLKRFFWQRLAIDRNGQRYKTWFKLKNVDVANQLHREYKSYKGNKWELIQIHGYKPLIEDSTECLLYKWSPITQYEQSNTFPSETSIETGVLASTLDIKYSQLMCLISDIPR